MWEPPERVEFEFRDGKRLVPSHLAPAMGKLETHRMTYSEAVQAANKLMGSDFINRKADEIVAAHFGRRR